jgi:hypothetical protein
MGITNKKLEGLLRGKFDKGKIGDLMTMISGLDKETVDPDDVEEFVKKGPEECVQMIKTLRYENKNLKGQVAQLTEGIERFDEPAARLIESLKHAGAVDPAVNTDGHETWRLIQHCAESADRLFVDKNWYLTQGFYREAHANSARHEGFINVAMYIIERKVCNG